MRIAIRSLAVAALLVTTHPADAQTWPAKPIRLIAAFAAGSAPDVVCRLMAERLTRSLGQQVIVDNRPGASSLIAAQAAAHAAPDGYTMFFATTAALVTKDFTAVGLVGKNPFVILANPGLPVHNLPELVALDKAQPGSLSFASDGPRNFSGMVGEWVNKLTGAKLMQVPYTVIPQGIQDTVAGRTQLVILAYAAARPFVADGRLRPIAVTSAKRDTALSTVPAVSETLPGFDFQGWFGVVAPSATPSDIVLRMNRELDRALQDREVIQKLGDMGVQASGADSPEGFGRFIAEEYERWHKVVREIGIEPE